MSRPIGNGAGGPQRSPAAPYRLQQLIITTDVQERLLLAGKAGVREILRMAGLSDPAGATFWLVQDTGQAGSDQPE